MSRPDVVVGIAASEGMRSGRDLTACELSYLTGKLNSHWVIDDAGCWNWTGGMQPSGYGSICVGRTNTAAMRVAYAVRHGSIPAGMQVCHKCDNRRCVNPCHLFAGTAADNARDRDSKGRFPHGQDHFNTNLTDAQVEEIRRRYKPGKPGQPGQISSQRSLAREFGISKTQLARIIHGKSWAHIWKREPLESKLGEWGHWTLVAVESSPGILDRKQRVK